MAMDLPLSSRTVTLFAPFSGVVSLPVEGLEIGRTYTLRLTDLFPTEEPKYWVIPTDEDGLHQVVFKGSPSARDTFIPKCLSRRVGDVLVTELIAPIV
jgi:hypothetical protein